MPECGGMSRYAHLKAVFTRRPSQDTEVKEDSRSETTLVPDYKKRDVPQDYNGKDFETKL
ncbi:hypothetical protein N7457_002867 [Penicillium paradoxum]|uniref:uncharacterized protein n=1 Tax=Penicillium paradoxum TaxID=176176 RepID=UPI0025474A1D|nr:uncharacterized protein N7457_002867 [Penicillium paradoxum]KAJ5787877.1 hypothetical protein N7457_002867 [Penicillium paradoxum]